MVLRAKSKFEHEQQSFGRKKQILSEKSNIRERKERNFERKTDF